MLSVYQQLKRNGFDDDHIILVADRSVADSKKNPEPGTVRATIDGPDLMAGAVIDYDASELTAADIMRIATSRKKAIVTNMNSIVRAKLFSLRR